tara:strand:+ start:721 stop:1218 length:498 start_codon:yes stop_codon:yes gene_type:complete
MNLNNLIQSLQKDNNKIFCKKIDKFIKNNIGHKLITFTAIDISKKYVERIYTNNPKIYPLLGQKPIPKNKWSNILNNNSKNYFIGKNKKEIQKLFFDYETIFSLGCGSIINFLVKVNKVPLGTINILDREYKYKKSDIKKIETISMFTIPLFINHRILMERKNEK